jgi:hypothetical protein
MKASTISARSVDAKTLEPKRGERRRVFMIIGFM